MSSGDIFGSSGGGLTLSRHWGELETAGRDSGMHFRMNSRRAPENGTEANDFSGRRLALNHWPRSVLPLYSLVSDFGDSFCGCYMTKNKVDDCTCGEPGQIINWVWDSNTKTYGTLLQNDDKDVRFHVNYSGGTAAIRGSEPMTVDQHYWEVKMTSLVYGTDMMVGVGTDAANIHRLSHKFCSILGSDSETWGLSYTGLFHHRGKCHSFAPRFGQGSIIGVHLDMWDGTLSFYKNRQPLGVACAGLKGKTLYAMVSSTAARSGMRIIRSCSFPSSLQFLCCQRLRSMIPKEKKVLDVVPLPPGLKSFLANNLSWLLGEDDLCSSGDKCTVSEKMCEPDPKLNAKKRVENYILNQIVTAGGSSGPSTMEPCSVPNSLPSEFSASLLAPGQAVLFQNCNRFMSCPEDRKQTYSEDSDGSQNYDSDDSIMMEVKKCKFSTDYLVDSSDGSDDELSSKMME